MWEVIELLAAWMRERGTRNAWWFLVFVVVPLLAAFIIVVGRINATLNAAASFFRVAVVGLSLPRRRPFCR